VTARLGPQDAFGAPGARPAGALLAIASGKGGVGKTVVAIGLARALARRGERVLLVDADLGMANIDVQLGVNPSGDIGAVVAGRQTLEESICGVLGGAGKPGGFDVISGRSGSGALAGLETSAVNRLAAGLAAAAMAYDRTLIDLAAGADNSNIRLAASADDVLIVINDEPTSLTDAYAFVKTLRLRDEGAAPFVVVNNAPDAVSANRAYDTFKRTCDSFLGIKPILAGVIRRDPQVPVAVRSQVPVSVRFPTSKACSDLDALADGLAAGLEPA